MKKILSLLALVLVFTNVYAQKDTLTIIAEDCCECVNTKDVSGSATNVKMKLGLCLLEVAKPYSNFLKEEHNIDIENMNATVGRKMGELVGMRMAGICPEFFQKLSDTGVLDEEEDDNENSQDGVVYGTVIKVENTPFVQFKVKDSDGKVWQLFWLDEFEGSSKYLYNYEDLKDQKVTIEYRIMMTFDSRINEYIPKYIITGINNVPPPPKQ